MTDNVTPFPSASGAPMDEMLATIDAAEGNKTELLRIALRSFNEATAILAGDAAAEDGDSFALVESLGMAYFALGTILDARRDIMVMSLRPGKAGNFAR
jgi:hypothetical protein